MNSKKFSVFAATAFAATVLTVAPTTASAEYMWGDYDDFETMGYEGYYDDNAGDDWYYDGYFDTGFANVEYEYGTDWWDYGYYDGYYDNDYGDDWYYDTYDPLW